MKHIVRYCIIISLFSIGFAAKSMAYNAGEDCDGFLGKACNQGHMCEHKTGTCGIADAIGVCVKIPETCATTQNIMPVCGCNGKTYSTDCHRIAAGVSKFRDGPCIKQN